MPINWIAVFVSALFPLIIGSVWYHPKVLGGAWMNASGMTPEKVKEANIIKIMLVSLVLGVFIAMIVATSVIHQAHIFSLMVNEPGFGKPDSKIGVYLANFMKLYGNHFRTFGHGAFHGTLMGLLLVTPIISVMAMYERRGFKYIAIQGGYWIVTLAAMGALICGWK